MSSTHNSASTEEQQLYWAKGTGFGTGSTASGWDVEQALTKQRLEEEHVTCLLQVLEQHNIHIHSLDQKINLSFGSYTELPFYWYQVPFLPLLKTF